MLKRVVNVVFLFGLDVSKTMQLRILLKHLKETLLTNYNDRKKKSHSLTKHNLKNTEK